MFRGLCRLSRFFSSLCGRFVGTRPSKLQHNTCHNATRNTSMEAWKSCGKRQAKVPTRLFGALTRGATGTKCPGVSVPVSGQNSENLAFFRPLQFTSQAMRPTPLFGESIRASRSRIRPYLPFPVPVWPRLLQPSSPQRVYVEKIVKSPVPLWTFRFCGTGDFANGALIVALRECVCGGGGLRSSALRSSDASSGCRVNKVAPVAAPSPA